LSRKLVFKGTFIHAPAVFVVFTSQAIWAWCVIWPLLKNRPSCESSWARMSYVQH